MPKNIVADTSCLVLLEKIDELTILQKLFHTVWITDIIAEEFGSELPEWIQKKEIADKKYLRILETTVDPGEASAIALAVQINGILILDDMKARRLASGLSLDYTGTLGVLVEAKKSGYISSLRDILHRIKKTNFYMPDELEDKLLNSVNEPKNRNDD